MPRSRMPHLSAEARPKAAPARGELKRGRAVVEGIDLSYDLNNPRMVRQRVEPREEDERKKRKNEVKEADGKTGEKEVEETPQEVEETPHGGVCDYNNVPLGGCPSDAGMFCLSYKSDLKVQCLNCGAEHYKISFLERSITKYGKNVSLTSPDFRPVDCAITCTTQSCCTSSSIVSDIGVRTFSALV